MYVTRRWTPPPTMESRNSSAIGHLIAAYDICKALLNTRNIALLVAILLLLFEIVLLLYSFY